MAIYTIEPNGFTSPISSGSTLYFWNQDYRARPQIFAGVDSTGFYNQSLDLAYPISVQFGTSISETNVAHTAYCWPCIPSMTSSGVYPCKTTVEPNGDQWLAGKRMVWRPDTKSIRLEVRPDDQLVFNNPRFQLYGHYLKNRAGYYRFPLDFTLGDAEVAWPEYVYSGNTVLLFQLKGSSSSFPPFNAQVRTAASGDTTKRDLYFLRRLKCSAVGGFDGVGEDRVAIFRDISPGVRYRFHIDMYLDWSGSNTRGKAYTCIWYKGSRLKLHSDVGGVTELRQPTIYGSATPDIFAPMWGIYVLNYYGRKSPYTWRLILHDCRTEIFTSKPSAPLM